MQSSCLSFKEWILNDLKLWETVFHMPTQENIREGELFTHWIIYSMNVLIPSVNVNICLFLCICGVGGGTELPFPLLVFS